MNAICSREYQVRFYEVDFRGLAQPITILNYLQDTAGYHASALGFCVRDLRQKNLTWVLSRYHVQFDRLPRARETLCVRSWPSARQGVFALRDFEVTDKQNIPIIRATSSWAVIDLEKRRPVSLRKALPNYPIYDQRALRDEFESLPQPINPSIEQSYGVRRGDLDVNRHVNNTVYAEWALESIPPEIAESHRLAQIEIGYRAEALLGDRVLCRTELVEEKGGFTFVHQLSSLQSNAQRELTRLKTIWQPL